MPSPISIPLSQPNLSDLERSYVDKVLRSPRLAFGPMLTQFESQMAALCEAEHAIAVSSGTAALHLIVRGLNLGTGHEVITSPFSFVASSNCVLYEGATPRFVDVHPDTFVIDEEAIESAINENTRAILAIDIFGHPAPWPHLTDIAQKHQLALIDDACEAPGARIANRPIGSWGNASAFGFYPNKQITTGEGGCITTNDAALADLCRSMRNQGRAVTHRMEHVRLGYNYRMNELSAALGCAQLDRFATLQRMRHDVARSYGELLAPLQQDIQLPTQTENTQRSWFVYVIVLKKHYTSEARDIVLDLLQQHGIGCAPYFPCIHLQPYYRDRFGYREGMYPVSESLSERSVALPFFPSLSTEQIHHIVLALKNILPQLPKKARMV